MGSTDRHPQGVAAVPFFAAAREQKGTPGGIVSALSSLVLGPNLITAASRHRGSQGRATGAQSHWNDDAKLSPGLHLGRRGRAFGQSRRIALEGGESRPLQKCRATFF